MSRNFEELDYVETPLGPLSLRRQRLMMLGGREIFEIKLGDDYLMSSLFTVVEEALARRGLAELGAGHHDVLVGGLGLGYTARAVLDHPQVASLLVVDALEPVLRWHRTGLVPLGPRITADPRCRLLQGDFFRLAADPDGFDPMSSGRRFDAILLDIDHSPRHLLHPRHADFYHAPALQRLRRHLRPGGVFAMWSDAPVDQAYLADLQAVFGAARADLVHFANPFFGDESASVVYIARDEREDLPAAPSNAPAGEPPS